MAPRADEWLRSARGGGGSVRHDRRLRRLGGVPVRIDLGDLGFDEGGLLLVKRALRRLPAGGEVEVAGVAADLALHLETWCRAEGHSVRPVWSISSGSLP